MEVLDIKSFHNQLFHKFMYLGKTNARRTHEKLEAIGLYRGQPVLLYQLWEKDGLSGRELATLMDVTPVTVTKMVRRLKESGFVTTRQDAKDSRVSRVYLTDQGHAVKDEVQAIFDALHQDLFKNFTPEELLQLESFIDRLTGNISTSIIHKEVKPND